MSIKWPHGSGSIQERPERPKPFKAQIRFHNHRLPAKSFETREDAENWIKKTLQELSSGTIKLESFQSVRDYLSAWLDARNPINNQEDADSAIGVLLQYKKQLEGKKNIAWNTHKTYSSILQTHVLPNTSPSLRLGEIQREDVLSILLLCLKNGAGHRTVEAARNILHRAFEDAISDKLLLKNPVYNISTTYQAVERKAFSEQESCTLINAGSGTCIENLIPTAISTGARMGELLAIKWEDINWDHKILYIRRQVVRIPIPGKEKVKKTNRGQYGTALGFSDNLKTLKSKRQISISSRLMQYLKKQSDYVDLLRALAGSRWREHELVFPSSVGTPMEQTTVRRAYKKILKKAGLPEETHFHDLRHTMISGMQGPVVGAGMKVPQSRAGQGDDRTTNRYTHVLEDADRVATEIFDDLYLPSMDNENKQNSHHNGDEQQPNSNQGQDEDNDNTQ